MDRNYYERVYGISSANPKGNRPDFTKCAARVMPRGGWSLATEHQCKNKCGHGPESAFCKTHAKQYDAA